MISGKRRIVLEELEALDEITGTMRPDDGFWLPYHVRYYSGRLHESGISRDACVVYLRDLAKDRLCDKKVIARRSTYRINDTGSAALAAAQLADPARPEARIELLAPKSHHRGPRWKIYGDVVDERRDAGGFYVVIEEPRREP